MMKRIKPHLTQTGFTLVEIAIVLAIVAFLLGGLLPTISSQMEQQRRTETRKYMEDVNNALLGYAISHKRLPCPDTDVVPDGLENAPCAATQVGTLPYKDLGVVDKDAYSHALVYAVTSAFTDSVTPFTLTTPGAMVVCPAATNCPATYLTNNAVAVIVSRGANGANTTSADELANDTADTNFVSHDLSQNSFDDLVIWISPNTLFNRMVAAGRLP
jgi:prepilin-type N-terminal cleavage/methylation domain-containing protein